MSYEESMKKLETIVRKMENDELDIDSLSRELREAQQLIKMCKERLKKVDEEIRQILENGIDK